jgi:hypothetical protein
MEFIHSHPAFEALFVVAPVVVLVVLLALTMRSIVMRDRAMVGKKAQTPVSQEAYEKEWRHRDSA